MKQRASALLWQHTISYAHRGPLGWLCPKHEPIDSDHLCIEWCLRGWRMPRKSSQTCHMHPISVLKPLRIRRNGCPPLCGNTPFHMPREGPLGCIWPKHAPIDSDHLCMKWCLRGYWMPEKAYQTSFKHPKKAANQLRRNEHPPLHLNTQFAMPEGTTRLSVLEAENEPVDSNHLCMEWCLRGWMMLY